MSLLLIWQRARVTFDPSLDAGDFELDPQQSQSTQPRWFAPDVSVEGLTPPVTTVLADYSGYDPQQDRDQTQRWFAPDEMGYWPNGRQVDPPSNVAGYGTLEAFDPMSGAVVTWTDPTFSGWDKPGYATVELWVGSTPGGEVFQSDYPPGVQTDSSGDAWTFSESSFIYITMRAWNIFGFGPFSAEIRVALAKSVPVIQGDLPAHEAWVVQTWFAPDATVDSATPPVFYSATQLTTWDDLTALQAGIPLVPAPDGGDVPFVSPAFNPATGFDWSEQPQAWSEQRWFQPDEAPPIIPTLTVATVDQQPLYGYDASLDRSTQATWFQPDTAFESPLPAALYPATQLTTWDDVASLGQPFVGVVPAPEGGDVPFVAPAAFDPSSGFDWSEQPQAWTDQRWFAPEPAVEPVPQGSVFTPLAPELEAPLWQEQPADWRPELRYQPEDDTTTRLPPGVTVATVGQQPLYAHDAEQERDQTQRWFQPDTEAPPILPNLTVATVDQQSELYGYDAQQDRSTQATWFQPDTESWTAIPNLTVATVDQQAPLWLEQPADWTNQRWHAPDPAVEGLTPPVVTVLVDFGYDPQQDRSTQPTWHAPDPAVEGLTTGTVTVATVDQQPLYGYDASLDRSTQPTWHAPEAEQSTVVTTAPPPSATVDQQAPLWLEQPYPLAGTWPMWYSQAVEPVDGPLQSWLFTTGAPTAAPAVLIDATNGDVYLSIGGNFIVPAS